MYLNITTVYSCACYCKDTKKEAIHNAADLLPAADNVVLAIAKILKRKQFTTINGEVITPESCACYCKDTKKEAIHNHVAVGVRQYGVVLAIAKILKRKQFTTD